MKRAVAVLIAALCLSGSAPQDKSAILWAKTWKDALDEAKIRNAPILFTGHKDG